MTAPPRAQPQPPQIETRTHGVVVVHGQGAGRQRAGFLSEVANGIADSLDEHGGTVSREFSLDDRPATATIVAKAPDGTIHRYEFVEGFWDDAFPPPRPHAVFLWVFRNAWSQLAHTFEAVKDVANSRRGAEQPDADPQVSIPWYVNLVYRVQLVALLGLLLVALVLAVPLSLILYVLRVLADTPGVRLFGFWDRLLDWIQTLDPFMTKVMGDSKRYVEHGMWSASARGRVERAAKKLLADDVDDLAIIAHSAGCGVAYDALLDGSELAAALDGTQTKLTLVTLGSAMNRYHLLSKQAGGGFARRYTGPLDQRLGKRSAEQVASSTPPPRERFYWLDIFARLDPVPAGGVRADLLAASQLDDSQLKRRRVINFDNPVEDHGGYFTNRGLVVPRLIRSISGGEYPWTSTAGGGDDGGDKWVARTARARVMKVAWLQTVRLAAVVAGIAHLAALWLIEGWRDTVGNVLEWMNGGLSRLIESLPLLENVWQSGEGDLATTSGRLLAVLGPLVLLLAAQRIVRLELFREL